MSRPARLLYAGPRQINAVLPTDLPAGLHFVIVGVGEETSPPEPIKVVASNFGIFTRRLTDPETGLVGRLPVVALVGNLTPEGRTVLNSPWTPARLGGTIELWGTGLGRTADRPEVPATERRDIEIDIGGRSFAIESAQAAACCLGVDRIRLRVPDQAPLGCFVPLSVRLRAVVYSNVETISISEDGSLCEDVPPIDRPAAPRRDGLVTLSRSVVNGETFDEAEARFGPASATFSRLPAPGTCLPGLPAGNPEVSATLDAGSELSLSTPHGRDSPASGPGGRIAALQRNLAPRASISRTRRIHPRRRGRLGRRGLFGLHLDPVGSDLGGPVRVRNRPAQSGFRCFLGSGGRQRDPSNSNRRLGPNLPRRGCGGGCRDCPPPS